MVERVLDVALADVCEDELSKCQMGFRRGVRVQDPVLIAQSVVAAARARRQNLYLVFVDFADAYTTVPHVMLLMALAALQRMGLHSSVCDVIAVMLKTGIRVYGIIQELWYNYGIIMV